MASVDASSGQGIGAERAPCTRLHRRPDEGLLGGVCAGLARRLQVNVTVIRVIAALTIGAGGVGVVLYSLTCRSRPRAAACPGGRGRGVRAC